MRGLMERARPWLAIVGLVLIAAMLLPPAGSYARQYAAVQALQYVVLAVAAPALLVIGAPKLTRELAGRLTGRQSLASWPPVRRCAFEFLVFMALVVAWRLPFAASALARDPVLVAAELVTLVAAGTLIWVDLTAPGSSLSSLSRPQRAALAAVSMWTFWAVAYITGMSKFSMLPAYVHAAAGGLSVADDRQIAVAVMWATPGLCFVPVVFVNILAWIRDGEDPDRELSDADLAYAGHRAQPRPPRGWR